MRLTRIHVDMPLRADETLPLPGDAANHLLRVLRLCEGDRCVLFNGDGHDYHATLVEVGKRDARVCIEHAQVLDSESPLHVTLVQALARGEKMDWIVQKATELGVAAIMPVHSARSEVKLDAARSEKRLAHWRSIAASACEQSGRARLPVLAEATPLAQALAALPAGGMRLLLEPQAEAILSSLPEPGGQRVVVAIGPEGGWSREDLDQLTEAGFSGLRFGPRVLRTETAGLAVLAALQARFGDV